MAARVRFVSVLLTLASCMPLVGDDAQDRQNTWPEWRGPIATGFAPNADPPTEWSESKNVAWKTRIPGLGHSSPIVWGDRVFLTSAVPIGAAMEPKFSGAPGAHDNLPVTHRHEFRFVAVDRSSGKIVADRNLRTALPHEGAHYTSSLASASAVTDGKHVFVSFGSQGVYCVDIDGNVKWEKQLGKLNTKHGHGEGSSPTLFEDTLIVNSDHEGQSFVVALDKQTGEQRWRNDRHEVTSWSSPIVVKHAGKAQVIVCGSDRVRGYDVETGKVIWECGGLSKNIVATPVMGDGIVFAASSYDTRAMLAIRLEGATGDITSTEQVLWSRSIRTPYVPSPLLIDHSVYFLRHYQNILSRVSTKSGEDIVGSPYRLGGAGNIYASPIGASGNVFVTDLDGTTMVLSHGDDPPKLLARNHLDDSFSASGALVGKQLFLRGKRWLYCIEKSGE